MFSIIFADEYEVATALIAEMRRSAGLSQREMATALNRSQGHIHRMETRQRPIDLVEFCRIARAAGIDPRCALGRLLDRWSEAGHCFAPSNKALPEDVAA